MDWWLIILILAVPLLVALFLIGARHRGMDEGELAYEGEWDTEDRAAPAQAAGERPAHEEMKARTGTHVRPDWGFWEPDVSDAATADDAEVARAMGVLRTLKGGGASREPSHDAPVMVYGLMTLPSEPAVPPQAARERRGEALGDSVDCTVFSPPSVAQGDSFLVQVFAHTPEQVDDARALATEFDEQTRARGSKSLELRIERGARLALELAVPGLEIAEPVGSLTWNGRAQGTSFDVKVPSDHALGNASGKVSVRLGALPVGEITFMVRIVERVSGQRAPEPQPVGQGRHYDMTFVSYARRDWQAMTQCVQMLETYGHRFRQDIHDIRRGARWEEELARYIDECDCFLLIWSKRAKRSKEVYKEVRRALERTRNGQPDPPAIEPIIIQKPPPLPWDDLSHLHFDDSKIYHVSRGGLRARLAGIWRR